MHILQTQLEDYVSQGLYPLHMPGHKRRIQPAPGLPAAWDLTEVPGTDDLHDAGGILREAMERTARLWGADRTWYLVNGATCGLLAGIRALAGRGAEVICARNCHKAVFHAMELAGYTVRWIMPSMDEEWGICKGISAGQVEAALDRYPEAGAVILTSPTYEGILSDVAGICRICHARGIPVLVDEAHGAHLMPASAAAGFPSGALEGGADLTVQSPHKTLPSLTQTALLHLRGGLVDPGRVEEELDIFETSSPSYPLMASLDGCTGLLQARGRELFRAWAARLRRFEETVRRDLSGLRILGCTGPVSFPGTRDPGKILIDAGPAGMSGKRLAAVLRDRYRLETEMAQGTLVLAMTSICDEEDALDRLAQALIEIGNTRPGETDEECGGKPGQKQPAGVRFFQSPYPVTACTLAEASGRAAQEVPLDLARGRICGEYLYFYPPGIPLLAPGEIITGDLAELLGDLLREAEENGDRLYRHGGKDDRGQQGLARPGLLRKDARQNPPPCQPAVRCLIS